MTAKHNERSRTQIKEWLHHRVQGPSAEQDWAQIVGISWNHTLSMPLESCFPLASFEKTLDLYWQADILRAFCKNILVPAHQALLLQLREESTRLEECTSEESIKILEQIVESPNFIRSEWIECFFTEKAVEEVLSDSLYSALRDFSTIIPRLVLRNLPTGRFSPLGMAGNLTEKLASQLEKVIEPEIRSFLSAGSQKAIRRACDFTVEQLESKTSVQMRVNLLRFALRQTFSFHLGVLTDHDLEQLASSLEKQMISLPLNQPITEFLNQQRRQFYASHKHRTIAELLGDLGPLLSASSDKFAELSWPLVSSLLASSELRGWMDSFLDELLDEFEAQAIR